jgi:hypothetical protein
MKGHSCRSASSTWFIPVNPWNAPGRIIISGVDSGGFYKSMKSY